MNLIKQTEKMKIHIAKNLKINNASPVSGMLNALACVRSGFIKGRIVSDEEFSLTPIEQRCKKCQVIYDKRNKV